MSDTFRQVGNDLPGSGGIIAANCARKLKITLNPTAEYTISGNRADLLAGRPGVGDLFETIDGVKFTVTSMELDDIEQGNSAKMTIFTECPYASATYGVPELIGGPQYTVKFQELRQRIEAHPACGTFVGTTELPKPTWDDWAKFTNSNWVPKPGAEIPDWLDMGPWTLPTYQDLKKRGVDEYTLYLPIVICTQVYTRDPGDIGKQSGRRNAPPSDAYAYVSNYQWLCGPDELQQRGDKYERTTTWMACEFVSPKLYSNQR